MTQTQLQTSRPRIPSAVEPHRGGASMAHIARASAIVVLSVALCACAAGSAESHHAASAGLLSQLLLGFWHGLIGPVMLIIEVVNRFAPHVLPWPTVRFYEAAGASAIYDIGFYLGLVGSPVVIGSRWRR
jgi:hypothetical protein